MTKCWTVISSLTQSEQMDLNGPPGQSLQIFLPIDEVLSTGGFFDLFYIFFMVYMFIFGF